MTDMPAHETAKIKAGSPVLTTKAASVVDVTPELLDAYKRILAYQFSGTALLVAILSVAMLASYHMAQFQWPFMLLVMLYGMLGAFFSALTRLYNVDQISIALISPIAARLSGWHLLMYSFVPLMVGAIASVIVYWGFVAELLSSPMFPKMSCKGTGGNTCAYLLDVINNYAPSEAKDYGKLLIWSFIAGFSERFVPDLLHSVAMRSQKDMR